jgi:hypothetical protein
LLGIREDFYNLEEIENWIKNGEIHEFKRSAHPGRNRVI